MDKRAIGSCFSISARLECHPTRMLYDCYWRSPYRYKGRRDDQCFEHAYYLPRQLFHVKSII
jgi:hypothetical protein